MIGNWFNVILVYPLLNLLVFFYHYIPDIGIVIIIITILMRFLLLPSFHRSLKHQQALQALQPKMQEIREKYKDDKERQSKALMELYSVHKVNPLSSCLPILIQLPILIALYQVFIVSLKPLVLQGLYKFVPNPGTIDPAFLNFLDLSHPNYALAILAGVLQFFQTKMSLPKSQANADSMTKMMSNYTLYAFPILTIVIGIRFPAGLALYWIVNTIFGIVQQYYILRKEAKLALAKA